MEASVGGPPISVGIVVVDPSAAVSHVDPAVAVTRVIPVLQLAYIEIVASAQMDDSGRYQFKADVVAPTDATAFAFSRPLADTQGIADDYAIGASKSLSDPVSLSDSVVTLLIYVRTFADTLTVPETLVLFTSPSYSDSVLPDDTIAFSHSKAFADGFAMNDLADIGGPVWSFSDTTANIVSMSDSSVTSNDKGVSDSVAMTDSGFAFAQNYVDPSYLAQDYVGVSSTF